MHTYRPPSGPKYRRVYEEIRIVEGLEVKGHLERRTSQASVPTSAYNQPHLVLTYYKECACGRETEMRVRLEAFSFRRLALKKEVSRLLIHEDAEKRV